MNSAGRECPWHPSLASQLASILFLPASPQLRSQLSPHLSCAVGEAKFISHVVRNRQNNGVVQVKLRTLSASSWKLSTTRHDPLSFWSGIISFSGPSFLSLFSVLHSSSLMSFHGGALSALLLSEWNETEKPNIIWFQPCHLMKKRIV